MMKVLKRQIALYGIKFNVVMYSLLASIIIGLLYSVIVLTEMFVNVGIKFFTWLYN